MIGLGTAALRILLALEPQDLRKGFQGLAEVALSHLAEQLGRETLFVFTNRTRTRIRLLYFDGTGLWIATKRLEAGRFSWPSACEAGQRKLRLAPEALQLLLDGVDLRGARFRPWYERDG